MSIFSPVFSASFSLRCLIFIGQYLWMSLILIYICIYYKKENQKFQPCVCWSICSITETNIIEIGKRINALRRQSNFFKNQIKNFEKFTWTKVFQNYVLHHVNKFHSNHTIIKEVRKIFEIRQTVPLRCRADKTTGVIAMLEKFKIRIGDYAFQNFCADSAYFKICACNTIFNLKGLPWARLNFELILH